MQPHHAPAQEEREREREREGHRHRTQGRAAKGFSMTQERESRTEESQATHVACPMTLARASFDVCPLASRATHTHTHSLLICCNHRRHCLDRCGTRQTGQSIARVCSLLYAAAPFDHVECILGHAASGRVGIAIGWLSRGSCAALRLIEKCAVPSLTRSFIVYVCVLAVGSKSRKEQSRRGRMLRLGLAWMRDVHRAMGVYARQRERRARDRASHLLMFSLPNAQAGSLSVFIASPSFPFGVAVFPFFLKKRKKTRGKETERQEFDSASCAILVLNSLLLSNECFFSPLLRIVVIAYHLLSCYRAQVRPDSTWSA